MRTPGVADVVSFGGFQKEYHVLADPAACATRADAEGLIDAVAGSNGATSGGYVAATASPSSWCAGAATCARRATSRTPSSRRPTARRCWCATSPRWSRRTRRGAGRWRAAGAIDSIEGTVLLRRGREPARTCWTAFTRRSRASTATCCRPGMHIVPFYDRTRLVDTTLHTVSHNMLEGVALVSLVLWLFLRAIIGLDRGRHHHAAGAADRVRGPLLRGRAGQPAVDGRDRFRHPARRRGHPGRERLPPPGRGASAARSGSPHVVARAAKEVVRPTLFSMSIIARRDDADLHARAGRGAHLPSGGADVRVRAAAARCSSR